MLTSGLRFIGHNSTSVTDGDKCDTPAGFNIIFPGMLERGIGMGLEIPLAHADLDAILRLRDTELKRLTCLISSFVGFFFVFVLKCSFNSCAHEQHSCFRKK